MISYTKNALLKKFDQRTLNLFFNVLPMLFLKAGSMIVSFLYVPLLINTLDKENYGIWLTITAIIAWINLFDIGLGNGLRNNLANSIASDNKSEARKLVSTSYFFILVIVVLLVFVFFILNYFVDWHKILNVERDNQNNISLVINIVVYTFFIQFIFKLLDSILLSIQKPAISALINFCGQLFSFIAIYVLVRFNITSFVLISAVLSVIPLIVLVISTLVLFNSSLKHLKPSIKLIDLGLKEKILNVGLKFFFLQIITIVIYQSNNIIIAHKLDQESVTKFNIGFKLIGIISMIFTIVITPIWSATTEAYRKKDMEWITNVTKRMNKIWLVLMLVGFLFVLFAKYIYKIWIGGDENPDFTLLALLLVYFGVFMKYGVYGYIINGIGKLKLQIYITLVISIIYIPITTFLATKYQLHGIVISMIVFSLINYLWSYLQYHKLISNKATGIWNK